MTGTESEHRAAAASAGADDPDVQQPRSRGAAPGLTLPVVVALAACGVVAGMLAAYPSAPPAPDIPPPPPSSVVTGPPLTAEELIDRTVRRFAEQMAPETMEKTWVCAADIGRFDVNAPFFTLPRFDESTTTPVTISAKDVEVRGNHARATVKTIQWVDADYQFSQGNVHLETGYFTKDPKWGWQICPSAEEAFR